ncbi:MAG: DegT/DnrJ/EryC1/StrS family aminotransferase [Patescibacteria group bacterium]
MIPLFKPSLGKAEEAAVIKVLRSGWLGNGPQTLAFEAQMAKLTHTKYAVALNSATAALHLSFLTSIRPGDEVISPSLTFVAANQTILQAGGKIVFSDCDPETLSTDVNDVLNKITRKTKAILVLHYGGHPMDLKPLTKVCREKQITLIEDCAHAAGSYYYGRHVGGFGDLGCFSFAAIKNITTGDGGMVVTNDKAKADRIRHLAWSGISSSTWKRYSGRQPHKWEYAVTDLGFKYQMNDISASIGLIQLAKLVKTNARRQKIYQRYNQAFISLSWLSAPPVKSWARSSHHNYFIQVKAKIRDRFIDYLNAKGISANVHYLPNHYYPMFKSFPSQVPTVEKVWPKIVMLPIYPDLSLADQKTIIKAVYDFN